MRGAPLRFLSMFKELCGADALQNVILTTTMWDEVTEEMGARREHQLQAEFWGPMMSCGFQMARFHSTHESAWDIINKFDAKPRPIRVQVEMVDRGKSLASTSAYSTLLQWWGQIITRLRERRRRRKGQPLESLKDNAVTPETAVKATRSTSNRDQKRRLEEQSYRQGFPSC